MVIATLASLPSDNCVYKGIHVHPELQAEGARQSLAFETCEFDEVSVGSLQKPHS